MKKLIAIMLLVAFAALTAIGCTGGNKTDAPTPMPSNVMGEASPSIPVTDTPTDTPNPTPTEDPFPYDRKEYDTLLAFFELADENGVKNGEKCFKDYDPNRTDFWGMSSSDETDSNNDTWVQWADNGHFIQIHGDNYPEPIKYLKGKLNFDAFDNLYSFYMYGFVIESVRIENCENLFGDLYMVCTDEAYMTGVHIRNRFCISSSTHVHYESTGEGSIDPKNHCFTVDLTVDGNVGRVWLSGEYQDLYEHDDSMYYAVYVSADTPEGHKFLGWYDESGKLISTESRIEISSPELPGCVGNFTYIARFE